MDNTTINRSLFYRVLEEHIDCARQKNNVLALVLVDIRFFHLYNLKYGSSSGEKILTESLARLQKCMKKAVLIERIGTHRLGLILLDVAVPELLSLAAKKIVDAFAEPFVVSGEAVLVDACVGVSIYPDQGHEAEVLISEATLSFKTAKSTPMSYHVASKADTSKRLSRWETEKALHQALMNDQLRLHYQPKVDLKTLQATASEALMRWTLPDGRIVSPDKFIPLAESSGVIRELTEWVVNAALREISELDEQLTPASIAINVSPTSIYDPSFLVTVESALAIWDVLPQNLTLEITENTLMTNTEQCFEVLERLRGQGIKVSIDDFGTGFSSLSYFKTIPADEIKIDQSFVRNMCSNAGDAKIVELIIDLSHRFGLTVVAEGVETAEILEKLRALGCDFIQGYYVSKPLSFNDYKQWLKTFDFERLGLTG